MSFELRATSREPRSGPQGRNRQQLAPTAYLLSLIPYPLSPTTYHLPRITYPLAPGRAR